MNKHPQIEGNNPPDSEQVFLSNEAGFSEWITSYLDGEASGPESEIARKRIQGSPEIRREAQDIQRAWDLLDFLPVSISPESKTLETLALVLQASNSQPIVLKDSESEGKTKGFSATPDISLGSIPASYRLRNQVSNSLWPIAMLLAVIGGFLGLLVLGGWRYFEARQTEKMREVFGVVENIQILRDANDIDFLKAIAVPELFGQPDSVASP